MKKSVILTIAVIYILAIVVVGFIGMKMQVYDEYIYVNDIVILTDGYKEYTKDTQVGQDKLDRKIAGHITKDFKKGLRVELKCQILPDNANEKKLQYHWDEASTKYKLVVNDDGTAYIEFYAGAVAQITIQSSDNARYSKTIEVIALDFSGIF